MSAPRRAVRRYDYTRGPVGRGIMRIALPSCCEQILWDVDSFLEIFWVGMLGPDYLAAMSLGFMTVIVARAVGMGIRAASNALVAHRVGAGDPEGAAVYAAQSVLVALVLALSLALPGILLAPRIIALLTQDPALTPLAILYLRAGFVALVFMELNFTLAQIHRGAGEPAYSLAGLAAGTVVIVILQPVLIFGAGPIPALGLAGAFLAVAGGRLAGTCTMGYLLASGRSRVHIRPRHLRPRWGPLHRILSLSWPASAQNVLERGANMVLLPMISPFGSYALAAWGVGNRVTVIARLPGYGIQNGVRTMVGQNVGAERLDRVLRTVRLAVVALVILMGSLTAVLLVLADWVAASLGMTGEAGEVGAHCLRILSLGGTFEAGRRVLAGAFQGAANPKPPMFVEAVVRWVFQLPAAYLLAFSLGLAEGGIWWAVSLSQTLACLVLTGWFFSWMGKRVARHPKAEEE